MGKETDAKALLITKLRDWWRGWNIEDLQSAKWKVENDPDKGPHAITYLTQREIRAITGPER